MRTDDSIIRYEIKKGNDLLEDFYYNLVEYSIEDIQASNLKPSLKKIILRMKNSMPINDDSEIVDPIDIVDIESKITYSNIPDPLGSVYKVIDMDSYHSNILIPTDSYIWITNSGIYYKHISLGSHPPGLSLVASNCNKSKYMDIVDNGINNTKSISSIIDLTNNGSSKGTSNLKMAQYGVKFY